jgi:hypothetical protein
MCSYDSMSRRSSWSLAGATAFSLVRAMETKYAVEPGDLECVVEMNEVLKTFWNDVFDYAIDGSPQQLTACGMKLIQHGVAVVGGKNCRRDVFTAVIDEPLMVEAAVNYFVLLEEVTKSELLERKRFFEHVLLPHINMRFGAIFKEQLSSVVPTSEQNRFTMPPRSAYGLL